MIAEIKSVIKDFCYNLLCALYKYCVNVCTKLENLKKKIPLSDTCAICDRCFCSL